MFDDFKEEVRRAYLDLKDRRELSDDLERPSPARLMRYCLSLYHRGDLKDDMPTLARIFNSDNKYPDLDFAIRKFGADGFRPLKNFITGKTISPQENIVKLLAVLINFQPRPYDKWCEVRFGSLNEKPEEIAEVDLPTDEKGGDEQETSPEGEGNDPGKENDAVVTEVLGSGVNTGEKQANPGRWSKFRKPALYGTIAVVLIIVASLLMRKQCMYWNVDRYTSVACSENIEGAEIIPLDKKLIKNLRKIMQPDTLTKNAQGKVWYVKIDVDSIEFYTSAGLYPLDRHKKLKPVTGYILDKYVLDKRKRQ